MDQDWIDHASGWISGDSFHVDIPAAERLTPRPSTGNKSETNVGHGVGIPDLKGRSAEEVHREAARIRPGEYFRSFHEFNRCIDSWAVLNGRVAARFATKDDHHIRVCRFGKTVRRSSRKPTGDKDSHLHDEDIANLANHSNSVPGSQTRGVNEDYFCGSTHDVRTAEPLHPVEYVQENLDREQLDGYWTAAPPRPTQTSQLQNEENSSGQDFRSEGTEPQRRPLTALGTNQLGNPRLQNSGSGQKGSNTQTTLLSRAPNSTVQNTKESPPGPHSGKNDRKVSRFGACGELSRLLPQGFPDDSSVEWSGYCPWRVRAQRAQKTGRIHITVCDLKHTCPKDKHEWRGPAQKSQWLAETLANRVVQDLKVPVGEILGDFCMDYKKSSSYHQMWRAKAQVRDSLLAGQRSSFHKIPSLLERLTEVDPGCIVDWSTQSHSPTFKRAFVCPSATRTALEYTQPLVALDACHTKNREYPTQLFLATTLDGNSQVLVLCYAVAPVENKDNWIWFLQNLARAIHGIASAHIPLISNGQKGLLPAVAEVFPGNVHGHCAHHMKGIVRTNFGKAAAELFSRCVYANTKKRFDDMLESLKNSTRSGEAATKYIQKTDARLYAQHAFPLPRMGKVTSNPGEQANSGLLPVREFAPFRLLVEMWSYILICFRDRRAEALFSQDRLTEVAQRRHERNLQTYGQWQVFRDGEYRAKVQTTDQTQEYLVSLSPILTCTCVELQEMCWPCQHIMAWDDLEGRDFSRHFHCCWKTSTLRSLYHLRLPLFLTNDLELRDTCLPPEVAVKKGRHRIVQIPSGCGYTKNQQMGDNEYFDGSGSLFSRYPIEGDPRLLEPMPGSDGPADEQMVARQRKRRKSATLGTTRCSCCGGLGHNRRTCSDASNLSLQRSSQVQPAEEHTVPMSPQVEDKLTESIAIQTQEGPTSSAHINTFQTDVPKYPPSSSEEDSGDEVI